jgi:hypothetical protein
MRPERVSVAGEGWADLCGGDPNGDDPGWLAKCNRMSVTTELNPKIGAQLTHKHKNQTLYSDKSYYNVERKGKRDKNGC